MKQKAFISARFTEMTPAAEITKQNSWGNEYECLVCGVKDIFLATIPCHYCAKDIEFFNKDLKNCPHCHKDIEHEHVLKACRGKYSDGDGWCEDGNVNVAYCHECNDDKKSVFYIDGHWSCVTCFDRGWQAVSCPHCDEFVTGDMDTIKYFACVRCEDAVRAELVKDGFNKTL